MLSFTQLTEVPLIEAGDDLAEITLSRLDSLNIELIDGDILVYAQKVVSKSENRWVNLSSIVPSSFSSEVAEHIGKDPRLIELILGESKKILRMRPGTIIVEHRLGFICANAGIDHSNVSERSTDTDEWVLLLPRDPDATARKLRVKMENAAGVKLGVLIIDSHGRAWRLGTVGITIGLAGVPGLVNLRGHPDLFGRELQATEVGAADEIAAGASLLMGQVDEGTPIVHVRGFPYELTDNRMRDVLRPVDQDLFR
jgi:coenzyme F420-0:L-glutamate ligase/coenzyme F420-1:gamma-L-glutamate ligase